MSLAMLAIGLILATDTPAPTTRPARPPSSQPATQPSTQPAIRADEKIDAILRKMEEMGDQVDDLACKIEYTVEDLIGLDEFTRFGRILYKRAEPNPAFLIVFEKTHQGGIVLRRKEWYLFKDRWLYEAKEASKTVIRREVIREGEKIDLFNLESSPFPIPFGQRRDEILKHFRVTLAPPASGDPPQTDHLVCVPRPGSRLSEQYSRMDFYVSRSPHLPTRIVAFEPDPGDPNGNPAKIIRAAFPDLVRDKINTGVTLDAFQLPPDTKDFHVIEEPLAPPGPPTPPSPLPMPPSPLPTPPSPQPTPPSP
jgi:hypothetical protein